MKKNIFILTAMLILMLCLTSCVYLCQHTFVESITKEPSCGTYGQGAKTITCSKCGYAEYGAIPALEHDYVESVYNEPSCGTYGQGDKKFTCTRCGHEYIEYDSIPALALEHDYVESVYKEPSCGTDGQGDKKFTCTQCGYEYIDYDSIPALEHEWTQATCTSAKECTICGKTEGSSLAHKFSESDGTCTTCGFGVKFILPSTPVTIYNYYYNGIYKACKIESIKIEKIQDNRPYYYRLTFIVESTYHKNGNNYSDDARFGWKLYDEDGLVVTSGNGYTDGDIKVGEKSKATISFSIGTDKTVQDGKTFRLELLNLS